MSAYINNILIYRLSIKYLISQRAIRIKLHKRKTNKNCEQKKNPKSSQKVREASTWGATVQKYFSIIAFGYS